MKDCFEIEFSMMVPRFLSSNRPLPFCCTVSFLGLKHVKLVQASLKIASIVLSKHPRNQELANSPDTSHLSNWQLFSNLNSCHSFEALLTLLSREQQASSSKGAQLLLIFVKFMNELLGIMDMGERLMDSCLVMDSCTIHKSHRKMKNEAPQVDE
ncbi:MAG: hypothetical protein EXX96DRAFT_616361 [Benjaminiella poitrasii]|nr:MAG: hypothetical protein EXX96DRAFT_616361 [Benjaminiella poitrasii]